MDLDKASDFERSLYELNLRIEREMPASNLETTIVVAISDARSKLYEQRERIAELEATIAQWQRSSQDVPKMRAVVQVAEEIMHNWDQMGVMLTPSIDRMRTAMAALDESPTANSR